MLLLCRVDSRYRGERPIPPVRRTSAVESPEVFCQCMSHRRLVVINLVADLKPADVVLPPMPIRSLVEEAGVGVSGRLPYPFRPLAPIYLESHVQFSYFVSAYSPLS